MSKKDKLLKKLFSYPKDFTYNDLRTLMKSLGFIEVKKGKTSGSRVAFFNEQKGVLLRLHKPHPSDELKQYQIKEIIDFLNRIGEKE